jgi:hypothetical protein
MVMAHLQNLTEAQMTMKIPRTKMQMPRTILMDFAVKKLMLQQI